MMRACRSPNIPRTCSKGRKPTNRYASRNRRRFVEVARIASRIATNGHAESCLLRDNLDENGGGNQSLKRRPAAKV